LFAAFNHISSPQKKGLKVWAFCLHEPGEGSNTFSFTPVKMIEIVPSYWEGSGPFIFLENNPFFMGILGLGFLKSTLSETDSSHLKIDGWKTIRLPFGKA